MCYKTSSNLLELGSRVFNTMCRVREGWIHKINIQNLVPTSRRTYGFSCKKQKQNRSILALANNELDAQIFNTFITTLYMCMFRAISCSSAGGQIVLTQHMVSSLSVSDRSVHRCALNGHLLTVTIPDAVLIQFDLLRMS